MNVELLQHSSLAVVIKAIRKCYASEGNSDSLTVGGEFVLGARDKELVRRIVSSGHLSTIEHMVYSFDVDGVSRGLLQELARHRIASLSVQSSRYCLGKLMKQEGSLSDYLVTTEDEQVNQAALEALTNLKELATKGTIPNDQLKYCLPESFKTSLIWTINARSLRNFLELRLDKRAHWEIRALAQAVFNLIPESHRILFENLAED